MSRCTSTSTLLKYIQQIGLSLSSGFARVYSFFPSGGFLRILVEFTDASADEFQKASNVCPNEVPLGPVSRVAPHHYAMRLLPRLLAYVLLPVRRCNVEDSTLTDTLAERILITSTRACRRLSTFLRETEELDTTVLTHVETTVFYIFLPLTPRGYSMSSGRSGGSSSMTYARTSLQKCFRKSAMDVRLLRVLHLCCFCERLSCPGGDGPVHDGVLDLVSEVIVHRCAGECYKPRRHRSGPVRGQVFADTGVRPSRSSCLVAPSRCRMLSTCVSAPASLRPPSAGLWITIERSLSGGPRSTQVFLVAVTKDTTNDLTSRTSASWFLWVRSLSRISVVRTYDLPIWGYAVASSTGPLSSSRTSCCMGYFVLCGGILHPEVRGHRRFCVHWRP